MTATTSTDGQASRLAGLLTRRRLLLWGTTLLLVSSILHGWEVSQSGLLTRSGDVKAADFVQFYVMGRLVDRGPAVLYDASAHQRESLEVLGPGIRVFAPRPNYGPQTAWAFKAIAWMPYLPALFTFTILSAAAYAAAVLTLRRAIVLPPRSGLVLAVLAGASPTFLATLRYGQLSTFALLAVACAVLALQRHRPLTAGAFLGLLAFKPTLLVVVVPALVLAREWRMLAGVGAAALAQLSVAVAVSGLDGVLAYAGALTAIAQQPDSVILYPATSHSVRGFLRLLGTAPAVASTASAALVLVAAPLGAWIWRRSPDPATGLGLLMVLTLVASPHVLTYDLLLTGVVLLTMARWLEVNVADRKAPVVLAAMALLYFAPFSAVLAHFTRIQLSTAGLVLVLMMSRTFVKPTPALAPSVSV